jgi:hypothetical protein
VDVLKAICEAENVKCEIFDGGHYKEIGVSDDDVDRAFGYGIPEWRGLELYFSEDNTFCMVGVDLVYLLRKGKNLVEAKHAVIDAIKSACGVQVEEKDLDINYGEWYTHGL